MDQRERDLMEEVKAVSSVDEAGNVADLSTPTTFYFPVPTPPEDHL